MANNNTVWDPKQIPQRYVVGFFVDIYKDNSGSITSSKNSLNESLNYYNIATKNNSTEAQICAALCLVYMENQGLDYHEGKDRAKCYLALLEHLSDPKGKILKTVDIIDDYFQFSWELK